MAKLKYANAEKTWQAVTTQKRIQKMYKELSEQASKELLTLPSNTVSDTLRKAYLSQYIKEVKQEVNRLDKEIKVAIEGGMQTTAEAVVATDIANMTKLGLNLSGAWSHVPTDVVSQLVSGKVYSGDWTLSKALWKSGNKVTRDVEYVVAQGIAAQKPTIKIAKDIEKYLNPAAKKDWDWSKVYPGTNRKVDYSAQRAARTLIQHSYQLSYRRLMEFNPFVDGLIWHSAGSERTCDLCLDRDGQIFPVGTEPLDHPMGLCWTEAYMSKSMAEIGNDLADWVEGKSNPMNDKIDLYVKKAYNVKNLSKTKAAVRKASAYPIPSTLKNLRPNIEKYRKGEKFQEYLGEVEKAIADSNMKPTVIEDAMKNLINNNDFGMRVDSDILDQILKDGRFMNQMEVGSSNGAFNPRLRKEASHYLFGTENYSTLPAKEFEKYGYLVDRNYARDLGQSEAAQYGNIIVNFKKENLFNRTTLTMDDSLSQGLAGKVVATPVSNPSTEALNRWQLADKTNLIKTVEKFASSEMTSPIDFFTCEGMFGRYIELQYHGELAVSDIESVVINPQSLQFNKGLADTIETLKKKGIKVVEVDAEEVERYRRESIW